MPASRQRITAGKFHDWVEVSSREETGGNIFPADLYVAPSGEIRDSGLVGASGSTACSGRCQKEALVGAGEDDGRVCRECREPGTAFQTVRQSGT